MAESARMHFGPGSPAATLVKVCVIGAGSLGKEHARIYSELAAAGQVTFVGLYDSSGETARKWAEKYRVQAFASTGEALAACDAASIATPTTTHFVLARQFLAAGKHVLVEKPMTDNAAQAAQPVTL